MGITMKDVAKKAGVSTATVSYVVNNSKRVSEQTCKKVKKVMAAMDYYPSAIGRSLRVQRTRTIGLMVPVLSNQYFTTAAHGIGEILQQNGYSLIITESNEDMAAEKKIIQALHSLMVDGLILVPCGPRQDNLQRVLQSSCPVVFLDRRPERLKADSVVLDNFLSTHTAIKQLIEKGRKKIGILLGATWFSTTKDRIRGYRQALKEAGLKFNPRLILHSDYGLDAGLNLSQHLLEKMGVDAIFAASSNLTLGAFLTANRLKKSIPQDVAIIGCDDLPWANATHPRLSMIEQPACEMGKMAAELLLKRIGKYQGSNQVVFLPTRIHNRQST